MGNKIAFLTVIGILIAGCDTPKSVFYCQQKDNRVCDVTVKHCHVGTTTTVAEDCSNLSSCDGCFTAYDPITKKPSCIIPGPPATTSEGCFERSVAYCYKFWWYGSKHGEADMCSPTQNECQHQRDLIRLQTSNLGPCRETHPDEIKVEE